MLGKAIQIAIEAHKHQVDKSGHSYIGHITRVMNMGKSENEKICGILHDLIEDTDWTFEQLESEGFPEHIIAALKCLTKISEEEDYDAFVKRVMTNRLAMRVKVNDLTDNLDVKRFNSLSDKDIYRLNKYLRAYHLLVDKLDEMN